ncbi:MAG: hypothetical protein EOO38_07975, partial [Cytophagaceae bacterium]
SDISRTATPTPEKEGEEKKAEGKDGGDKGEKKSEDATTAPPPDKGKEKSRDDDLPDGVQQKLARLETLTAKYKGMLRQTALHRDWHLLFYSQNALSTELLRNYRAAHARVSQTEAFEATLREHTPLANVSDPGALVEFLNQRSLQSEMVMQELKRITGEHRDTIKERDELKGKLEDAEKRAKEAFDDAAGLRKEREEQTQAKSEEKSDETDPLGAGSVTEKALPPTPATASKKEEPKEDKSDTFFDYDNDIESQVKKQEAEITQQRTYINELETENATLRQDLDSTRLDLDAMKTKVDQHESEVESVKKELNEAKQQAQSIILNANKLVENTIAEIKSSNADKETTRNLRENLTVELKKNTVKSEVVKQNVSDEEIKPGDWVKLTDSETTGQVIEIIKDNVVIAMGDLRTVAKRKRVQKVAKSTVPKSVHRHASTDTGDYANFSPEIDVRGMRTDEAIHSIEKVLDRALMMSFNNIKIIHGKGDGILRKMIRDYLKKYDQVGRMEDEHADRGGDGITYVYLK